MNDTEQTTFRGSVSPEEDPLADLVTVVRTTKFEITDKEGISILRARFNGFAWAQIFSRLKQSHPNWSTEQNMRLHFLGWIESKLLPEDVPSIFEKRIKGVKT